jgi:hypothetical protein
VSSKATAVQKQPTISPERALKALTGRLDALQRLKGRQYDEAATDETEWKHFTQSIIEAVFGDPSPSLNRFFRARAAGEHNIMGVSPRQRQTNFELRLNDFDALLQSMIGALRLQVPEEEIKGVYGPGDQYGFYRDLSSLIATTTQEIFIVDPYLDEEVFNLYVAKVPGTAAVRTLSNKISGNVETVARMYAKSRLLELRSSRDIHDRAVFLDQRSWMIGQSIKDAARKAPTNMIELNEPVLSTTRTIYEGIWAAAAIVIQ